MTNTMTIWAFPKGKDPEQESMGLRTMFAIGEARDQMKARFCVSADFKTTAMEGNVYRCEVSTDHPDAFFSAVREVGKIKNIRFQMG